MLLFIQTMGLPSCKSCFILILFSIENTFILKCSCVINKQVCWLLQQINLWFLFSCLGLVYFYILYFNNLLIKLFCVNLYFTITLNKFARNFKIKMFKKAAACNFSRIVQEPGFKLKKFKLIMCNVFVSINVKKFFFKCGTNSGTTFQHHCNN